MIEFSLTLGYEQPEKIGYWDRYEKHYIGDYAARERSLEVLQWSIQKLKYKLDEWTCSKAAEGGHLPIFQWLRSQTPPCHWNEKSCSHAALGGHLPILQWLRSQTPPCPWDKEYCLNRAKLYGK